jgi:NAD(P)-dependent dehydrogenase (short-subunit alcohol dehydrogenase family)
MSINVDFIVKTLDHLLKTDKLVHPCRLCVISSIFQEFSRNNKFSYSVSKSALGGLIRSAAVDLFLKGSLINGILPGPIDNAMTRKTLTPEQIKRLEPYMVSLESVYSLCKLLCFNNSSITGQSILVDNGLSISRNW